jgi:hypothetical protein
MTSTRGAIRAGKKISDFFRKALPDLPDTNADTLSQIIDHETRGPEMLEMLERVTVELRGLAEECEAVIRKARSG